MSDADLQRLLAPLRVLARRHSRVPDDADDLLQDALLEAVRAGRSDLTQAVNYRWITGTIRNLGAMTARGAVRRRLRESRWVAGSDPSDTLAAMSAPSAWGDHPTIAALRPSLREVARLALAGHDRREIAWVLGLSDTAMRQRITALRRKLASTPLDSIAPSERDLELPLGLIRRALLPVVIATNSMGAHVPDGHLLILSKPGAHARPVGGNKSAPTHGGVLSRRDRPVGRSHAR